MKIVVEDPDISPEVHVASDRYSRAGGQHDGRTAARVADLDASIGERLEENHPVQADPIGSPSRKKPHTVTDTYGPLISRLK